MHIVPRAIQLLYLLKIYCSESDALTLRRRLPLLPAHSLNNNSEKHWQAVLFISGITPFVYLFLLPLPFSPFTYFVSSCFWNFWFIYHAGWGPHAYFRMLADESRNPQPAMDPRPARRPTTLNSLMGRPYDSPERHAEIDMVDSSEVLDELESGRKL